MYVYCKGGNTALWHVILILVLTHLPILGNGFLLVCVILHTCVMFRDNVKRKCCLRHISFWLFAWYQSDLWRKNVNLLFLYTFIQPYWGCQSEVTLHCSHIYYSDWFTGECQSHAFLHIYYSDWFGNSIWKYFYTMYHSDGF